MAVITGITGNIGGRARPVFFTSGHMSLLFRTKVLPYLDVLASVDLEPYAGCSQRM